MAGYEDEFVINLRRNNLNTPWGFRLHGGKEYNTFLSVQRVFSGSPADGHLQRGDYIVAVDNENVTHWTQQQAHDLIQSIGLTLALVVKRGGIPSESRPVPSQVAQPAPSFVSAGRKPLGQQQQPYQAQQQLSPQLTSTATLKFQPASSGAPYTSNDLENVGPSYPSARPGATWAPPPSQNSFSSTGQVRLAQGPSYSPSHHQQQQQQPNESYGARDPWHDQHYQQQQQQPTGAHQEYGGYAHHHPQQQQQQQQQQQHQENNHVHDRYDKRPSGRSGYDEPVYDEERREEGTRGAGGAGGGRGGNEEMTEDEYQALSVRDIKQMFNKPDEDSYKVAPRELKPAKAPPTLTRPIETIGGSHSYLGPGIVKPKQPSRPTVGSIQRGPPPEDNYTLSPPRPSRYGMQQQRFPSPTGLAKPTATVSLNKLGGSFAGIVQPSLPQKTPTKPVQKGQKKKDFDPAQSAVYQILLEEEKRAKEHPNREPEEEEPRRQQQQQPGHGPKKATRQPQGGGADLTKLLERDQAQLAPFQEEPRASPRREHAGHAYQEPPRGSPYQEPRSPAAYQEPRAAAYQEPRGSPYRENPRAIQPQQIEASHQYRGPPPQRGGGQGNRPAPSKQPPPAASSYSAYDYTPAFLKTQYVDGIPTSDF